MESIKAKLTVKHHPTNYGVGSWDDSTLKLYIKGNAYVVDWLRAAICKVIAEAEQR